MPTLPTITINDTTIWNRVYNAFNGDPANYRQWLIQVIKAEVERRECQAIRDQAELDEANTCTDIRTLLGGLS